jgi:ABC-type spermidine/putrescine transport system permease subunit II
VATAAQEQGRPRRAGRRELRLGPIALAAPAAVGLLAFFLAPLAAFLLYSFLTAGLFSVSGPLTLDAYRDVVTSRVNGTLAVNSFIIGFATAAATLLIALPIAYWLRYAAGRAQTLVLFLVAATFFASYLVRIYAWRSILGENGLLNSGLISLGVIDEPIGFLIFNRFSVTVALVHIFLPYVVLVLFAGFRPISPELIEASRDLGASAAARWRKVVLPLIAAPAATSFLFVFILAASDPVTAQFLGGTDGAMLGIRIREALVATGNWPVGAALSFLMLAAFLVCFAITAVGLRFFRLDRIRFVGGGTAAGNQRSVPTLLVTILALLFLFVPLVIVVLFSFHSTGALSFPFVGFSTRWYEDVFSSEEFRAALENSAIVGLVAAGATLLLGTAAAYGLTRMSGRTRASFTFLFFVPLTLPALFLGIALLTYYARLDFRLSLTTVAIAHVVYVFPYYLLVARAALDRLDPALEESAADLGASPWKVFRRVTLPQVWPLLAGATVLAFALSFDEFIITFFVIGPQSTLPMFIWSSLRRTVDPSINVISTVLMGVTLLLWVVAFAFVVRGERRRGSLRASVQASLRDPDERSPVAIPR